MTLSCGLVTDLTMFLTLANRVGFGCTLFEVITKYMSSAVDLDTVYCANDFVTLRVRILLK